MGNGSLSARDIERLFEGGPSNLPVECNSAHKIGPQLSTLLDRHMGKDLRVSIRRTKDIPGVKVNSISVDKPNKYEIKQEGKSLKLYIYHQNEQNRREEPISLVLSTQAPDYHYRVAISTGPVTAKAKPTQAPQAASRETAAAALKAPASQAPSSPANSRLPENVTITYPKGLIGYPQMTIEHQGDLNFADAIRGFALGRLIEIKLQRDVIGESFSPAQGRLSTVEEVPNDDPSKSSIKLHIERAGSIGSNQTITIGNNPFNQGRYIISLLDRR